MPGKTDIRWSDSEWAALEGFAASVGLSPGRAAKQIVVAELARAINLRELAAQKVGSAAPRERESGGGDSEPGQRESARTVRGRPASSRSAESAAEIFEAQVSDVDALLEHDRGWPKGTVVTTRAARAGVEEAMRRDGLLPPPESAGSAVRPPAGGSAASSSVAEPAVEAEGVRLVDAVAAALRSQGVSNGVELMARKAIRSGGVVVDGEACTDPERLVDPASLGAPS